MFDTHCHLNFSVFNNNLNEVVDRAKKADVNYFIVPGTDVETSKKAVEIAEKYEGIYAAVGIHPHNLFHNVIARSEATKQSQKEIATVPITSGPRDDIKQIEKLLSNSKVVAVGEVGIDKHRYQRTKYLNYQITDEFVELQKFFLKEQIKLAIKYNKSLILHNREAKNDFLEVLLETWSKKLEEKTVFHCCEPDEKLLNFAKEHKIFIGVDGDITYKKKSFDFAQDKQEFVKKIPLELLVLETDSPYLSPIKKYPNEPKNLPIITKFIANLKHVSINQLVDTTTENAKRLFFR